MAVENHILRTHRQPYFNISTSVLKRWHNLPFERIEDQGSFVLNMVAIFSLKLHFLTYTGHKNAGIPTHLHFFFYTY